MLVVVVVQRSPVKICKKGANANMQTRNKTCMTVKTSAPSAGPEELTLFEFQTLPARPEHS